MPTEVELEPLFEELPINPSQVDYDNCVIHGVALTRNRSDHGRLYEKSAMDDLVQISEGASVYLDGHVPVGKSRLPTRRNGVIKNIRRDGDYNRGDWHLFKKHADTGALLEAADEAPESIMISHEVMEYSGEIEEDGLLHIRRVTEFRDYALVTAGGTTKSIFEDGEMNTEAQLAQLVTARDIQEKRPELFECICAAAKSDAAKDHDKRVAELMAELDVARARIAELETKVAEHEAIALESARVEAILGEASEMKVAISEETAVALAKLEESDVTTVLKSMLTEDGDSQAVAAAAAAAAKKPESDSGASGNGVADSVRPVFYRRRRLRSS